MDSGPLSWLDQLPLLAGYSQDEQITIVVFTVLEVLFTPISLLAFGRVLYNAFRNLRCAHATGKVVRLEQVARRRDGVTRILQQPIIRFVPADGRPRELPHPVLSNIPPAIGSEVTVLVDPARPNAPRIFSPLSDYLPGALIGIVLGGVAILLLAIEVNILAR